MEIDQNSYRLGVVDGLTRALVAIKSLKGVVSTTGSNEEILGVYEAEHEIQQLLDAEIK